MNKDAYWVDNHCNFIFFSNYKTAVTLDELSRRFFVLIDDAFRHDLEWYAPIWDLVENNPGIILDYYQKVDLTGFNPNANAPITEYQDQVTESVKRPEFAFLDQLVEEQQHPFNTFAPLVNVNHVANYIRKYYREYNVRNTTVKMWLQDRTAKGRAKYLNTIDWKGGQRVHIWSLDPKTKYTDRKVIRDIYQMPKCDPDDPPGVYDSFENVVPF